MKFNFDKLKGLMKEKRYTQNKLAEILEISESTLNLKLNGNAYFSQIEIYTISKILEISGEKYEEYFFTLEV